MNLNFKSEYWQTEIGFGTKRDHFLLYWLMAVNAFVLSINVFPSWYK